MPWDKRNMPGPGGGLPKAVGMTATKLPEADETGFATAPRFC